MNQIEAKIKHFKLKKREIAISTSILTVVLSLISFVTITFLKTDDHWGFPITCFILLSIIGLDIHRWWVSDQTEEFVYSVFKIGLAVNYLKFKKVDDYRMFQIIKNANSESNFIFLPFFKEYKNDNYLPVLKDLVSSFLEKRNEAIDPYFSLEGGSEFLKENEISKGKTYSVLEVQKSDEYTFYKIKCDTRRTKWMSAEFFNPNKKRREY